jgi:hypothetical protein
LYDSAAAEVRPLGALAYITSQMSSPRVMERFAGGDWVALAEEARAFVGG